ncbi:MAG: hypothetical protein RAP70_11665 [Candidatus Celaenobacter antarcticus]|nr:hypothetical protein [Candidatus Tenebribacter davisii]MDP8315705.1 hypothetical protein [Candidatus Celaenobacter antarcticus]
MILEISEERAIELIDRLSKFIAKKRMAAPAIMTIESLRPLARIGSQLMHFLAPFAEIIFNAKEYQEFAVLLENENYVGLLIKRIDEIDVEMYREERKEKRLKRKRRNNKIKQFFKFKKKN